MSRRSEKNYFEEIPGSPAPLTVETYSTVRFEEVDSLGIVWHGRYSSYFEDGRKAFGDKYGLGYLDMYNNGIYAPVVQLHFDYHTPLTFPEEFKISTTLHYTEAVKLNISYALHNAQNEIVVTGYTVQIFTTHDLEILLVRNEFLENFWKKWQEKRS